MTFRDTRARNSIIVAALLVGSGVPPGAMAQTVNSLPDGPVACDTFRRSGNGTWSVLRAATLYPNGLPLSLAAGQTFAPNQMFEGFDVKAILDRNCGNS